MRIGFGLFGLWLALAAPPSLLAASSHEVEARTREIAAELRCVVCQSLSVADSPSDMARQMRELVREQVEQGKDRQQVLDYFASRYGEFVLLSPEKRGFNLLVWGLPFVGLAAGAFGVYAAARRWTRRASGAEPPPIDPAYTSRVRRELEERAQGRE